MLIKRIRSRLLGRYSIPALIALDAVSWFVAMYVSSALRVESYRLDWAYTFATSGDGVPLVGVIFVGAVAAITHVGLASVMRIYQGRVVFAGFDEFVSLAAVTVATGALVTVMVITAPASLPRSVPAIASFVALVLCVSWRGIVRALLEGASSTRLADSTRVVIVGAGEGGRQLVESMHRDPERHWTPVAFVDDDPRKRHLRFRGIRVLGTIDALPSVAHRYGAETVVLAIPNGSSELFTRANTLALDASMIVKVLPGIGQLLDGVSYRRVRDLEPGDLLGRRAITTDLHAIAGYLTGKRVLVTGAGGSIGSELCRQVWRFNPDRLVTLDRDESALHSLHLSIHGRADLESRDVVLADIRDQERMQEVFMEHRPDVVFHAAALKHVNILEQHAGEAVRTNVWGTLNVLQAAELVGVERFINISTDKAADPINVLGLTKRLSEMVTSTVGGSTRRGSYQSVRFGNVLGTNGSVLKTFASQIEKGGPLTVTDPQVTRYFMTVDEAVQLVLQSAAIGRQSEALVLDMGDPIAILDVARQMIGRSEENIDIVFTGLKPGEKLHEDLFGADEVDERPVHPLISHVAVPPADLDGVRALPVTGENEHITRSIIEQIVTSDRVCTR